MGVSVDVILGRILFVEMGTAAGNANLLFSLVAAAAWSFESFLVWLFHSVMWIIERVFVRDPLGPRLPPKDSPGLVVGASLPMFLFLLCYVTLEVILRFRPSAAVIY